MARNSRMQRPGHATVVAYAALFFALAGSAYAVASINSADVVDNSLRSVDLKNGAAVKSEDVVNDTVTGGGLAGPDIKELTLAKVPNADQLDGQDSTHFWAKGEDLGSVSRSWDAEEDARMGFDTVDVPAGETQIYAFGVNNLAIHYQCPADPATTNGIATIEVGPEADARDLFIDNGEGNPIYIKAPAAGMQTNVATAATGEGLTIQMQSGDHGSPENNLQTIIFFSVHRPGLAGVNNGLCHAQGQVMDGQG